MVKLTLNRFCFPSSASASSVDDDDLEDYADVTKATTNIADEMSKVDSTIRRTEG
jgi:hypothetical protein